jgi:chromosome segregation ATPase
MALFSGKTNPSTPKPKKLNKEELALQKEEKDYSHSINVVNTRLTLLEDRYGTLRDQLKFSEKTLLDNRENMNKKVKILDEEMKDLNSELKELKDKVSSLQEEIKRAAKNEDVKVIDKYLELWEPLEFVTRAEVKKALEKLKQ